jgi:hypothetical protein
VFEIDECAVTPDLLTQMLACNQVAGMLEQKKQNGERLTLQANANAALQELSG